jgi:hypothetical protein
MIYGANCIIFIVTKANQLIMKKIFFLFVLAMSLTLCTKTPDKPSMYEGIEGKIKVIGCSYGCTQYLVSVPSSTSDTFYYPINLPNSYKQGNMDGVNITVSFDILSDSTQIYVGTETDGQMPLFKVKNINITKIKNSK